MLSTELTQAAYEQARNALSSITWDPRATTAQKLAARQARDALILDYVGQAIDEISARTAQYTAFITAMEQVIAGIGRRSPVAAVGTLQRLVDDGKTILDAATGVRRGAGARAPLPPVHRAFGTGAPSLRILCVHGIGDHHSDLAWQADWQNAITGALRQWQPDMTPVFDFILYDDIFDRYPLDAATIASAVWKLGVSGIVHGIGDLFRRQRGLEQLSDALRWTAGMVAQWADNERLRAELRDRILGRLTGAGAPDLVCAHSLGSLACYDTFVHEPHRMDERSFLAFGSQIGNPFVRNSLGGRLVPLIDTGKWYHLFNRHDNAFTSRVRIQAENFFEVETDFDIAGILDHDAIQYLSHPAAATSVWRPIAGAPIPRSLARSSRAFTVVARKPKRRALLVGINDYPDEADRLEGCVNDVFLMSSVLQEAGFDAEDIRVVLNDRATAADVFDRLQWLLDDVHEGDQRVLYYSGHGAQIPAYGVNDEVDHLNECLVTYDFDWTPQHSIVDDQIFDLYTQLPYGSHFVAIFDCCHSGGMIRAGGPRVRGLEPPDDIRHRALRWNADLQMWEERKLAPANKDFARKSYAQSFTGKSGSSHRLGRAIPLRQLPNSRYDAERRVGGHGGPYLPTIFEACGENEYSYEYRHGVTSYGAFTYSLAAAFRAARGAGRPTSFKQLCDDATRRLHELRYDQTPCLVGPKSVIRQPVPWIRAKGAKPHRKRIAAKR